MVACLHDSMVLSVGVWNDTMSYVSEEKAARLLLVSRDTVLKWVKDGRLQAKKAADERYLISRDSVLKLLTAEEGLIEEIINEKRPSVPCWEYNAENGKITDDCHSCPVFQTRKKKCYEVGKFLKETGHGATCCATDCEDCSYYKAQRRSSSDVVILPDSETLKDSQERESN